MGVTTDKVMRPPKGRERGQNLEVRVAVPVCIRPPKESVQIL